MAFVFQAARCPLCQKNSSIFHGKLTLPRLIPMVWDDKIHLFPVSLFSIFHSSGPVSSLSSLGVGNQEGHRASKGSLLPHMAENPRTRILGLLAIPRVGWKEH